MTKSEFFEKGLSVVHTKETEVVELFLKWLDEWSVFNSVSDEENENLWSLFLSNDKSNVKLAFEMINFSGEKREYLEELIDLCKEIIELENILNCLEKTFPFLKIERKFSPQKVIMCSYQNRFLYYFWYYIKNNEPYLKPELSYLKMKKDGYTLFWELHGFDIDNFQQTEKTMKELADFGIDFEWCEYDERRQYLYQCLK